MSFSQALERHLRAIRERDLHALAATVAEKELVLVMSDGRMERSTQAFLEAHRGWFEMKNWTLDAELVHATESADLAVATLRLDYREPPAVRQASYLTLVFQRKGDKWLMILDQNTPIKGD